MNNAFSTINAAKKLKERHPDAPASVAFIGLVMATFANGKTGTGIRPGVERLAELTGYHTDTVQDAIEWLVARGELRRDKKGYRGSAACFTWVGGMQGPHTPAIRGMQGSHTPNAGVSDPSHLPNLDLEQLKHEDRTHKTDMRTRSSEKHVNRTCIEDGCGNTTRPWHSTCDPCLAKADAARLKAEQRLARRGNDDWEIRTTRG